MILIVKNVMVPEIVINAQVPLNHKQKNVLQNVISDGGNTKETAKFVPMDVNLVNHQHSAKNVTKAKSCMVELVKLLAQLDITLKTEFVSKHVIILLIINILNFFKIAVIAAGKFENKDIAVYRDNCKLVYDKPWSYSTTNDEIRAVKDSCGAATLIVLGGTNPDDDNQYLANAVESC